VGKMQKAKPTSAKSSNDTRKNGKAPKQNPKAPNKGATGRTVGGYSPAALERRSLRRGNG
jgi:hypothetical protein